MTMIDTVDRAVIIGAFTWPYQFWTRDGKRQIGREMLFESDDEAESWFKEHYPEEYKIGVEMRKFE